MLASTRLDTCVDPSAMRSLLAQALPECAGGAGSVEQVRVLQARRNASKRRNPHPLTLLYEVDLRAAQSLQIECRRFYGKVYRDGASGGETAAGTLHLPALDMRLWRWPQDPGLPQLPLLLQPEQTMPRWGERAQQVSVLRYQPEVRATLRYSRQSEGATEHLYAKTFADERGAAIHRRFVHFWALAQRDGAAPRVAEPLDYDHDTRTLWQRQAQGRPLRSRLAEGSDSMRSETDRSALAAQLAGALARVHEAPLALSQDAAPRDPAHWLTEVRRRSRKIGRAAPELADRAARLAAAIEAAADRLAPQTTLIHGDFHSDQVWVDDDGHVVLFDFDEFAAGDPMEDLAAFLTRLAAFDADADFAAAFVSAYARLPTMFDARRLAWHLSVQQLLQASRAFVFQVADWRREVERRLARAETLAAGTESELVS